MNSILVHWQPSLGGFLLAVGHAITPLGGWYGLAGQIISTAGALLLGTTAAQASKVVVKPEVIPIKPTTP